MVIAAIRWDPNSTLIDLGFFALRYYSLFFMMAFVSSYLVTRRQFKHYGVSLDLLDRLTIYVFLGTLIGARLAHCFFYDFAYFSVHPLEIFLPVSFEPHFRFTGFQGLASHGGGLGIIISLLIFSRHYRLDLWFLLDQVSLVVPLAGFFIRLGNLMNSEIIGKPTNVSWAFIFVKEDALPRHPTQLYEAFSYLIIFLLMYRLMDQQPRKPGFYFGLLLILVFAVRIIIESFKEIQSSFEAGMLLDMGQLLSIPFILTGLFIMLRKSKHQLKT
jgi:phosphatidylglycerol:prolipoprotein diacylglycerol transferase